MKIAECREVWEEGLTPKSVIDQTLSLGSVLVILQDGADLFHCHRYFPLGGDWNCSVDGQCVPFEAVLSWLNNPSAIATNPESYIVPEAVTV